MFIRIIVITILFYHIFMFVKNLIVKYRVYMH